MVAGAGPTNEELEILKKYSKFMSDNISQFPAFNKLITDSGKSMYGFSGDISGASNQLESLSSKIKNAGINLRDFGAVSTTTTKQIALIASAVLDIKEVFSGFSMEGTNNFVSQVGDMSDAVDKLLDAKNFVGLNSLAKALNIEGAVDQKSGSSALSDLGKKLKEAMLGMARQGDNLIKIRDAYLQASVASGEYGDVISASGTKFENINKLLSNQIDILSSTMQATNLTKEQTESYYLTLSKIPGMVDSVVRSSGKNNATMSGFVAAIQLARGAGRDFSSVAQDIATSFENYGLKGEDALKYVSDMTAIQERFKLRLEDVRTSINSTSGAFKNFVDTGEAANRMQQSAVNIMSTYVQGFMNTKMTGQGAIDIITSMTGKMKTLTLEQKSFLSAQTGGPGGIRGGLQIEKMLREGKTDEVLDRVRKTMMKQFGKIVTLEDATQSDAAAAQFTRQRSLLTKGPFGQLARTDEEAARMLEVFKQMETGKIKSREKVEGISLEENILKGETLQRLGSYNDLSRMRSTLESIKLNAMVPAAETTANLFGGELPGASAARSGEQPATRLKGIESSRVAQDQATRYATEAAQRTRSTMTGQQLAQSSTEIAMGRDLTRGADAAADLVTNTMPAALSTIASGIASLLPDTVRKAVDKIVGESSVRDMLINQFPSLSSLAGATTAQKPQEVQVTVQVNANCKECGAPHPDHAAAVATAVRK